MNKIQELLKMDMGECIEWLIDNQYDFNITPKEKPDSMVGFINFIIETGELSGKDNNFIVEMYKEFKLELKEL